MQATVLKVGVTSCVPCTENLEGKPERNEDCNCQSCHGHEKQGKPETLSDPGRRGRRGSRSGAQGPQRRAGRPCGDAPKRRLGLAAADASGGGRPVWGLCRLRLLCKPELSPGTAFTWKTSQLLQRGFLTCISEHVHHGVIHEKNLGTT